MSRRQPAVPKPAFVLLSALLPVLPLRAAPQDPPSDPAATAATEGLAHKARGRDEEAAAAMLRAAQHFANDANAPLSARIAAEGTTAMALYLDARTTGGRIDGALALRDSLLGRIDAAFRDQVGVLTLEAMIERGDDRALSLARELAFVDNVWICGPFDNERGAAFGKDLPSESGFDPAASHAGKVRATSWRRLDGMAPRGSLWLGAVLRPAEQVACTVAFALVAERAGSVALHFGTSGAFVLRCNGAVVHRRDADHAFAYDQEAVAVPLQAGPNLVVLKLCHQDAGPFATSVRVAELTGGPCAFVRASAEPAVMELAAATKAVAGAPGAAALQGARSAATVETARGVDAMWLAMLWLSRHADPENDRRDHRFAAIAANDLPDVAQARMLLAATRVRNAKNTAELDENERRADYEAMLAKDPSHVEASVLLGQMLLQSTGLVEQAEMLARNARTVCADHEPATMLMADVLQARGLGALAAREWRSAAARKEATVAGLRAALRALDQGNPKGRSAVLELQRRLHARSGDVSDGIALAELALRTGFVDEAMQTLDLVLRREPLMRRAFAMRADLAESRGRFDEAISHWAAWLALCPDDDDALAATSRLHGLAGRTDDQIEALRAALECNPNRRDDQRHLEYLAAEATPFYEAHAIDAASLRQAKTPEPALDNRDPLCHLLRQRVVQAHKNGTVSEYQHLVVRVLTEAGARSMSSYRVPHYGGEQRARLLACSVHKQDGTTEEPKLRGAAVSLPSLAAGDVVELKTRVDDLGPSFFGDYFGLLHFLSADDGSCVVRSELVVIAEAGREYRFQAKNGAPQPETKSAPDGSTIYRFAMEGVDRDAPEPGRPDARERAPLVRFTTFRSWDHFSSWWWDLIRGQMETTPAMKAKVQELIAGCTTQEQRIAAIYRFVSTDVRYEAWEFGVHGYKPYATSVIFERRHGDCKDKALLLCALLSEVGVKASPVLIFADEMRSDDDLELPMVQHFNHCIAWMPEQDGRAAQFLDGTATWHPVGTLPEMDQGADVLVVETGKAKLLQVPWTTPEQNNDRVEWNLELRDASPRAQQIETPTGNAAVRTRAGLAVEPARRTEHLERQLVSRFGPVTLGEATTSDLMDLGAPVRVAVDFVVKELGQKNQVEWQLPSTFAEEPLAQLTSEPERRTPLLLGVPRGDERVVAYRLPEGYRPASLPEPVEKTGPFGSFTMKWRLENDRVVVTRTLKLATARVEPADYAAFRDFVGALRAADSQRILLKKEAR